MKNRWLIALMFVLTLALALFQARRALVLRALKGPHKLAQGIALGQHYEPQFLLRPEGAAEAPAAPSGLNHGRTPSRAVRRRNPQGVALGYTVWPLQGRSIPGTVKLTSRPVFRLTSTGARNSETPKPAMQDDDEEEREFQAGIARRAMQENCLICHSEEIITTQRLTLPQWKAEVEKMVGWGSPLPADQQQPLISYLASQYTVGTPRTSPATTSYDAALANVRPQHDRSSADSSDSDRGGKLYGLHCANCHGPDAQGAELGPNLVEKPVLLRPGDYHEIVRKGRRRMPGLQTVLSPAQEDDVLAWLRRRHYQPANSK